MADLSPYDLSPYDLHAMRRAALVLNAAQTHVEAAREAVLALPLGDAAFPEALDALRAAEQDRRDAERAAAVALMVAFPEAD